MNAKQILLIYVVALCFVLLTAQETPNSGIDIEVNGKHYKAPFFEETVTSVPEKIIEADMHTWDQMRALFEKALRDILIARRSPFMMMSVPVKAFSILKASNANKTEMAKEGINLKIEENFIPDNIKVYADLKKYAKEAGGSDEQSPILDLKPPEFMNAFGEYLNELGEVLRKSPTGSYLKWREMTVDGVPLSKVSTPYYEYFKSNGFSGAIWLSDQAMNLLSKFSG